MNTPEERRDEARDGSDDPRDGRDIRDDVRHGSTLAGVGVPVGRSPVMMAVWAAIVTVVFVGDLFLAENWRSATHLAGYLPGLLLGGGVARLLTVAPQPDPRRALLGCLGMVLLALAVFSPRFLGDIASGVSPGTVIGFAGMRFVQIVMYRQALGR